MGPVLVVFMVCGQRFCDYCVCGCAVLGKRRETHTWSWPLHYYMFLFCYVYVAAYYRFCGFDKNLLLGVIIIDLLLVIIV